MKSAAAVACCQCLPSVSSNAGPLCGERHDMHKTMRRHKWIDSLVAAHSWHGSGEGTC